MQTGRVLKGCYRVVRQLGDGVGGFAAVYLVEHVVTRDQFAMKVPTYAGPDMELQFQKEINLLKELQRLDHPHLVRYFDDFIEGGVHYLVMLLAKGKSLQTLLNTGKRFTEEAAIDIILQVLDGLKAAHRINIIHRDIKPNNIMYDGSLATLIDFGIARAQGMGGDTQLLIYGARTGYYHAPEQPQMVLTPDPRLDIYSIGVTLYELITGRAMEIFPMESIKRLTEPVDSVTSLPGLSPVLETVLKKATAAKPAQRHQTIDQLIADLGRAKTVQLAANPTRIDFGRVGWNSPSSREFTLTVISGTPKKLHGVRPTWVSEVKFIPPDMTTYPKRIVVTAKSTDITSTNQQGELVLTHDSGEIRIPLSVEFGEAPPNLTIFDDEATASIRRSQEAYKFKISGLNQGGEVVPGCALIKWEREDRGITGKLDIKGDKKVINVSTSLHFRDYRDNSYSNAILFIVYDRPASEYGAQPIYTERVPVTITRR
jgi:serine/threonine protein kinase